MQAIHVAQLARQHYYITCTVFLLTVLISAFFLNVQMTRGFKTENEQFEEETNETKASEKAASLARVHYKSFVSYLNNISKEEFTQLPESELQTIRSLDFFLAHREDQPSGYEPVLSGT
jgi:hypothetical protein